MFCLFELKKASLALPIESRLEKIFSMGINCMSLAVWLEDRKCSAGIVGLDLVLGLSIVRRCSLKRSFQRRFVSPIHLMQIWRTTRSAPGTSRMEARLVRL